MYIYIMVNDILIRRNITKFKSVCWIIIYFELDFEYTYIYQAIGPIENGIV